MSDGSAPGDGQPGDGQAAADANPGSFGDVTDLTVQSVTNNSVTLQWTEVTDDRGNPASYAIRYSEPPLNWASSYGTEEAVTGTGIGNRLTHTFTGLSPSTEYEFELVVYRGTLGAGAVFGDWSNIASGTTDGGALTAGTASATAGDAKVTLSATAPSGGTAPYSYEWHRSTSSGTKGSLLGGATSLNYIDTAVTNGTTYYYTLTAADSAGTPTSVDYSQQSATPSASGTALFSDGFESHTTGLVPSGGENGFAWGGAHGGGGDAVRVTSAISRSGSNCLEFHFGGDPDPNDDAMAEQRFSYPASLEIWAEYYVYFLDGSEGLGARYEHRRPSASNNNKFFTFWADDYQGKPRGTFQTWSTGDDSRNSDINVGRTEGNGDNLVRYPKSNNSGALVRDDQDRGRWIRIRVHLKVADLNQSNGVLQLWKDGALLVDVQNDPFYDTDGANNYLSSAYLMGWSNSGFDSSTSVFIDDFSFYTSNPGW